MKGAAAAGLAIPTGLARHVAASQPGVFTLYMSPYGSNSASGLTMREALLTLDKVQSKLKEYKPTIDQDIEVRILHVCDKPYEGQRVTWTHTSPTHTISFMPSDYQYGAGIYEISGRPVFDGGGSPSYLFWLDSANSEKTNLAFYYLQIQRYTQGGIALIGDPERPTGWNGYNTIYGCYFYLLGNKHTGQPREGYGGVSTWNSRHNTIKNNHFVALENIIGNTCGPNGTTHCSPLIHGVYLAHRSSHNLVTHNRFQTISGDPIRVRNYSNFNKVLSNTFERTGTSAFFSAWHGELECRSWLNEFRYNASLACGYGGEPMCLFEFCEYHAEAAGCRVHARRLSTSGNHAEMCPFAEICPSPEMCHTDSVS